MILPQQLHARLFVQVFVTKKKKEKICGFIIILLEIQNMWSKYLFFFFSSLDIVPHPFPNIYVYLYYLKNILNKILILLISCKLLIRKIVIQPPFYWKRAILFYCFVIIFEILCVVNIFFCFRFFRHCTTPIPNYTCVALLFEKYFKYIFNFLISRKLLVWKIVIQPNFYWKRTKLFYCLRKLIETS